MAEKFPKAYLYHRIVRAKLFMDAHFQEEINLDSIADEAFFSKFHFIRLFKTIYGKTPHQYLISVRIEQAKLHLQAGLSIAEVCFKVGFDSIPSFTGLFKRLTKSTPAFYQKQQSERKKEISQAPLKFIPNCFAESGQRRVAENRNFQEVS